MIDQMAHNRRYVVGVHESEEAGGALVFTFAPKRQQQESGPGAIPKRSPQFIVVVRQQADAPAFDWRGTPDDPGTAREEIEAEIADRLKDRSIWIDRVTALVDQVERWAREMHWSTRRVEKKLDDSRIGRHRVPALLMQEDTCRVLLEPVGRSAPGAEGVVDIYLMPAYDDIASLYYYGNQWNLHYILPDAKPAANLRESEPMPLTKETLETVLAELRQHAI